MLMPKRVKYRRVQRGRLKGKATRGNTVTNGTTLNLQGYQGNAGIEGYDTVNITNGAEVTDTAGYYTYNQLANGVIADNATLVIVRDYDRSVGGTYYKLMTYTEYIAKVTRSAGTITDRTSAHYGEYYFTFTYFDNYQDAAPVGANYVYSANKDAYDVNALYLVVPNANANVMGTPNYSTITDKEFFLSIKPAQVSDAVKVTGAQTNVPAASSYVLVGTTKYNMSKVYNDFTKAGFA